MTSTSNDEPSSGTRQEQASACADRYQAYTRILECLNPARHTEPGPQPVAADRASARGRAEAERQAEIT